MCKATFQKMLGTKFQDVDYLDEGGNSYVYKAVYSGEPVAIKVYNRLNNPDRYKRFQEEIATMKRLTGITGIVPLIDSNEQLPSKLVTCENIKSVDDMAYFVMPFYPDSLSKMIKNGKFGNDGVNAVKALIEIAKAVQELHIREKAHRDLKPDNVLVSEKGHFDVSDFGLCLDLKREVERHTQPTEIIGAINYRAPEYLRGRLDESDHRPGDIFSQGRILWALLMNKEPFNLTDYEFERAVTDIMAPIRKPHVLREITTAMIQVDPARRPLIGVIIEFLENWLMEKKMTPANRFAEKVVGSEPVQLKLKEDDVARNVEKQVKTTLEFLKLEFDRVAAEWIEIAQRLNEKGVQWNSGTVDIRDSFDTLGLDKLKLLKLPEGKVDGVGLRLTIQLPQFLFLSCHV
jgi:serine/threonine protein kinase